MGKLNPFSAPKAVTPPPAPAPVVMPTPDSASIQQAKAAQQAAMMARSGRASTVLSQGNTGGSDKLGG